jgi:hypothetical protein
MFKKIRHTPSFVRFSAVHIQSGKLFWIMSSPAANIPAFQYVPPLEAIKEGKGQARDNIMRTGGYREGAGKKAEVLLSKFEEQLLRYAMFILGDNEFAQDVVEKAFVRLPALLRGKKVVSAPDLEVALYRLVNRAAGELAIPAGRGCRSGVALSGTGTLDVVRSLGFRERQVVALKILERKSAGEISRIMEISEETVVALLYKSVKNVAIKFKEAGLL